MTRVQRVLGLILRWGAQQMWIWIKKLRIESWLFVLCSKCVQQLWEGGPHHWYITGRRHRERADHTWPHHLLRCAAGHLFPLYHWWELVYVLTSFVVLLAIYFPSITSDSWYMYSPPSLCCRPPISPPSLAKSGIFTFIWWWFGLYL